MLICCRFNRVGWSPSTKACKVSHPWSCRLYFSCLLDGYIEWRWLHQQCNSCPYHVHCCTESRGPGSAPAWKWIQRNFTFCLHYTSISIQHSSGRFWKKLFCFTFFNYDYTSSTVSFCTFPTISSNDFNSSGFIPVPCYLWCFQENYFSIQKCLFSSAICFWLPFFHQLSYNQSFNL